ncbi:MAG: hypothetical protein ACKOYJ_01255, partial [Planctomycetia bacterium]
MQMPACRRIAVMVAVLVPLVATQGCGTPKKKELTIAERLAAARQKAAGPQRALSQLNVAKIQIARGDLIDARDTIEEARGMASGEGGIPVLLEVARSYVAAGDPRAARKALTEVVTIGNDVIEDAARKAKVMADAGALFGNEENGLADRQQAKALLAQATTLAEGVDDRFRAEALAVVAMGYVSGGMPDEAAKMVAKLEACLEALDEPRAKAEALASAASVYAKTGNTDKSASLLRDAAAAAEGVERPDGKAYALLAVANAEYAAGNTEAA